MDQGNGEGQMAGNDVNIETALDSARASAVEKRKAEAQAAKRLLPQHVLGSLEGVVDTCQGILSVNKATCRSTAALIRLNVNWVLLLSIGSRI